MDDVTRKTYSRLRSQYAKAFQSTNSLLTPASTVDTSAQAIPLTPAQSKDVAVTLTKEGLETWHIVLIVVGSVVILGGVGAFLYFKLRQ
jgi:hypothetical protein